MLPVLRPVHDRYDNNLISLLVHFVDDDVRIFEKLTRTFDETRTPILASPGVPSRITFASIRAIISKSRTRIVFCHPLKDAREGA